MEILCEHGTAIQAVVIISCLTAIASIISIAVDEKEQEKLGPQDFLGIFYTLATGKNLSKIGLISRSIFFISILIFILSNFVKTHTSAC